MDASNRRIVLDVAKGDAYGKPTVVQVLFCDISASIQVGGMTIHIPWSEIVHWQSWLANRVEAESK